MSSPPIIAISFANELRPLLEKAGTGSFPPGIDLQDYDAVARHADQILASLQQGASSELADKFSDWIVDGKQP